MKTRSVLLVMLITAVCLLSVGIGSAEVVEVPYSDDFSSDTITGNWTWIGLEGCDGWSSGIHSISWNPAGYIDAVESSGCYVSGFRLEDKTFGDGTFSIKAMQRHTYHAASALVFLVDDANYIMFYYSYNGGIVRVTKSVDDTRTQLFNEDYPTNLNQYYNITVRREGTQYTFYFDGVEKWTGEINDTVFDGPIPIGIAVYGNTVSTPFHFDDLIYEPLQSGRSVDDNWQYFKNINICDNSGNTLTDHQTLVQLNAANFPLKANISGADIRFTDTTGNYLDHWIENWNYTNKSAKIWINVPNIPASESANIRMYYGNHNATNTSDGRATFVFFDDFNDGIYSDQWDSYTNRGSIIENDGYIQLKHSGYYCGLGAKIYSKTPLFPTPSSAIVEFRVKAENNAIWGGSVRSFLVNNITTSEYYAAPTPAIAFNLDDCSSCGGTSYSNRVSASSYNEILTGAAWTKGEWNDFKIVLNINETDANNSEVQFHRLGNVEVFTEYPAEELFPFYVELSEGSCSVDYTGKYDYIRIRNYANVEPSVNIGTEELTNTDINTNNSYYGISVAYNNGYWLNAENALGAPDGVYATSNNPSHTMPWMDLDLGQSVTSDTIKIYHNDPWNTLTSLVIYVSEYPDNSERGYPDSNYTRLGLAAGTGTNTLTFNQTTFRYVKIGQSQTSPGQEDGVDAIEVIGTSSDTDITPPSLTITSPVDGATFTTSTITVTGTTTDDTTIANITVNGNAVTLETDGSFTTTVSLTNGVNTIIVLATDAAGNTAAQNIYVTYIPDSTGSYYGISVAYNNGYWLNADNALGAPDGVYATSNNPSHTMPWMDLDLGQSVTSDTIKIYHNDPWGTLTSLVIYVSEYPDNSERGYPDSNYTRLGLAAGTGTNTLTFNQTTFRYVKIGQSQTSPGQEDGVDAIEVITAESSVDTGIAGDLNGNAMLDTGDVTLALRMAVGLVTPDLLGDMNSNGIIDTGDATLMLRAIVGLE